MKKFILSLAITCTIIAMAQTKYSPSAQLLFNNEIGTQQRIKGDSQPYIPITLRTTNAHALDEYGIIIGSQIGQYVTAWIPSSLYPQLGKISEIEYVNAGSYSHILLDEALPYIGYDKIQETPYMQPYTGKGVVVGIVDIGFQWDHVAFRNADGSSRIIAAWNQNDTTGWAPEPYQYGSLYETEEDLFTAPICDVETHGTHVASIAAGSALNNIPYGGIAHEATLILVEASHDKNGGISNESVIDGIKFIFDYAEMLDMPCVINLSIGGYFGPHDGTSAFDIICDSLQGEGRLIVGAMGNSGEQYYHLGYDFDTQPSEFRAGLRQQSNTLPIIDIWSEKPIKIDLEFYHGHADTILDHTGWIPFDTLYENTLQYFDREILVEAASQQYSENNLYNTMINTSGIKNLGNSYFALKVQGEGGKVNMWVNSPGTQFSTRGFDGWLGGDTQMTLNETGGTGKRITSVGSFTSDTAKDTRTGSKVDYELYAISPFSSRGPSADGRIKPEVCAPGCIITAGFNKVLASDPQNYFSGRVTDTYVIDDSTYYYGTNSGTSMAAPIVTGTYALWLQAHPRLTPEEAKEILRNTSTQDVHTTDSTGAGYGKINPYGGLQLILEQANIESPNRQQIPLLYPSMGNGQFNILAQHSQLKVEIFNTAGALIASHHIDHVTPYTPLQFVIDSEQCGIYFIKITSPVKSDVYKYILHR